MAEAELKPMTSLVEVKSSSDDEPALNTLGHVRLRDKDTHAIILIPTPSDDPKDPLNWSVYRTFCRRVGFTIN